MKKFGFTLAEILFTLGIVGVIAAITLPTLMNDTTTAQIGPKLAKAVSMFEQANESLLNANSVDALKDSELLDDDTFDDYGSELGKYLKITPSGGKYLSKDGMTYEFQKGDYTSTSTIPHQQRIGTVTIDINAGALPNESGTDVFYFSWWNDGSLRPKGATDWGEADDWTTKCKADAVPEDASYCAGHVFENNLKVLYK